MGEMRIKSLRICVHLWIVLCGLAQAESAERAYQALEDRFFDQKLDDGEKKIDVRKASALRRELAKLPADGLAEKTLLERDLLVWEIDRRLALHRLDHPPEADASLGPKASRPPPEPRERYEVRLKYEFGVEYGPDELLDRAFAFWDAAEADLARTCRRIDPALPWPDVMERLKDDHPAPDGLLEVAEEQTKRAIRFVERKRLVTIPESARKIGVRWGDPEAKTPYGHYIPPDEHGQGWYVVIPIDKGLPEAERQERLRSNNIHWTRCVALHEAIPGHHLQFAVAGERESRVERMFYNSAFVEGWGLYCEGMMAANGYFDDPRDRASQLKMRLWRAARVIIDLGTHLGGMTKDEAVELLVDGVGMERTCARDEVDRYVDAPLYYSGYMAGCLEIEALRAEVERREGDDFDLCAFHDRLLEHGALPFRFVRRVMLDE